MGGKGNEGVAANVSRTKGALGYVEYAYAKRNNIPYMLLQDKDGKFVSPTDEALPKPQPGGLVQRPGHGRLHG